MQKYKLPFLLLGYSGILAEAASREKGFVWLRVRGYVIAGKSGQGLSS